METSALVTFYEIAKESHWKAEQIESSTLKLTFKIYSVKKKQSKGQRLLEH